MDILNNIQKGVESFTPKVVDAGNAVKDWAKEESQSAIRTFRIPEAGLRNIGADKVADVLYAPNPILKPTGLYDTEYWKETDARGKTAQQLGFDVFNTALNIGTAGTAGAMLKAGKKVASFAKEPVKNMIKETPGALRGALNASESLLNRVADRKAIKGMKGLVAPTFSTVRHRAPSMSLPQAAREWVTGKKMYHTLKFDNARKIIQSARDIPAALAQPLKGNVQPLVHGLVDGGFAAGKDLAKTIRKAVPDWVEDLTEIYPKYRANKNKRRNA